MLKIVKLVLLIVVLLVTDRSFSYELPTKLKLNISNIEAGKGTIIIAIYDKESQWLERPCRQMSITSDIGSQSVSFEIPHGKYAISIFQDLNSNGKLDKGLFGIPKEPIGLGNNYHPAGKPSYRACLVEHGPKSKVHEIKLYYVI